MAAVVATAAAAVKAAARARGARAVKDAEIAVLAATTADANRTAAAIVTVAVAVAMATGTKAAIATIAADVRSGADGVRGGGKRDHPRSRGALGCEVVQVEREVVVHVDESDDDADVLGEGEPRRDIPVVVEARHEHLVPGAEIPRKSAG